MKPIKSISILVLLFTIVSSPVYAAKVSISPTAYYFNYEEFSTTGISLDKETGFVPGIKLVLDYQIQSLLISPYISVYDGKVTYSGSTQSGQPHKTQTLQNILYYGINMSLPYERNNQYKITLGIRNAYWDRDILTRNNIRGLHELYSWFEASAGLSFNSKIIDNSQYTAGVSILYILQPEMKIYLENSTETLKLGVSPGLRFSVGKTWKQSGYKLGINLFSEYWQFGRSNTIFTNDFFGSSVFITEPESNSFHTGIELIYSSRF